MDKDAATHAILAQALSRAAFDGWSQKMLGEAAQAAGFSKTDAIRVFPNGVEDALAAYASACDEAMEEAYTRTLTEGMKLPARVARAMTLRFEYMLPHREAVRRALALQRLPMHFSSGLSALYHTVDSIWRLVGDTSTDFSFYTKRLSLAYVFIASFRFWLDDQSAGQEATRAFIERRINDVLSIGKLRRGVEQWFHRYSR